jgi:hypothetical protein
VRGRTAQRLLLGGDWGGVSAFCAWVCAVTTLTPRPPFPPAGQGEQWVLSSPVATRRQTVGILSARLSASDLRDFHLVTARELLLFCSPRPGSGRGAGGEGKDRATAALGRGLGWRKLFLRLSLRGHHPHPPAPSPASGRGGEARAWGGARLSGRGGETRAWGDARPSGRGGAARAGVCLAYQQSASTI